MAESRNKPAPGEVSASMGAHQHRFEMLARAQVPGLYRYAYWLCRDRALAEDLVQETLLRAWRSLDSLREEAAARRWLITILRNEFMRELSKRRDTVAIDELPIVDTRASVGGADTDVQDVRRAMAKLTPEYREPLALQVIMGCSTQEIAEMLELTQGTVLTRLHRARNQLREMLGVGDKFGEEIA
ncbi:MAG TPA: sigma-70 family RNA polymerase sigma factor [Gammaproteobacteria bacterium]|nr:sigma-70 family RNA polymerase sigma factor [Gammaproteobacteria bacterium]HEV2333259.1 sigma-70 family RNA polymerase sigma factor [Gammaproteobacteria bacterium]